jgi:hypothetical protein
MPSTAITAPESPATANARPEQLSSRLISAGCAFVQDLRRGHYQLGVDIDQRHRLSASESAFGWAMHGFATSQG